MKASKLQLGNWETTAVLINLITTKMMVNFFRLIATADGVSAWIVIICSTVLSIIFFLLINILFKMYPGSDFIDIVQKVTGKFGCILIGTVLIIFYLMVDGFEIRIFSEDMKIIALTATPISIVELFFIVSIVIAEYLGLKAISRLSAMLIPVLIVGYSSLLLMVLPYFDPKNLTPILGPGIKKIAIGGVLRTSNFIEIFTIFILAAFFKDNKSMKKIGIKSILLSSMFMTAGSIIYTGVYTYPAVLENILPLYSLSRLINYGRFFQRVESFYVFLWVSDSLMYTSLTMFLILYIFKKTFDLPYYKPLIIPFIIIAFIISLMPSNLAQVDAVFSNFIRLWSWVLIFGIPILLIIPAAIKKLRSNTNANKT